MSLKTPLKTFDRSELSRLFSLQKEYLDNFFEKIDIEKSEKILQKMISCKGSIIFSGIGKSGIIAKKWAMTLLSTGTKAFFLHPVEALHGDIGILSSEDLCVFLSKSGQTEELLHLVPYIKEKKSGLISIVSVENSKLAKESDLFITLPLKKELCPFNLAPTTSTSVQLIFADVLTVFLMQKKKFNLSEYAKNHPAGSIGKKIHLKVNDLMIKGEDLPLCFFDDKLIDLLPVLSSKASGCLLIVDKECRLKGVFTDGDLRRTLEKHRDRFFDLKIGEIMTKDPESITKDLLAFQAMEKMEKDPHKLISILPVLEKGKVAGLIRLHDILQAGLE